MMTKEQISELLQSRLDFAYCDTCKNSGDDCDYCHRKSIGWSLSKGYADKIADEILMAIK